MAWSKPLAGFTEQVKQEQNNRLRATAQGALERIINRSPVRTGRFRGNNMVSVGSTDESYDYEKQDKVGRATLAEGDSTIHAVREPFTVIYVQNNLPYAEALEEGHSQKQAPQGIYELAFNDMKEQTE